MSVYKVSFEAPKIPYRPNQCPNCKNYENKQCNAYTEKRQAFGSSTVTLGAVFEGEASEPCPKYATGRSWKPSNPSLTSSHPIYTLEHIFVFANCAEEEILNSPAIKSIIQDTVGSHYDVIVEQRIPIHVFGHSDVAARIIQTKSIPNSAWSAMMSIDYALVEKIQLGRGQLCVQVQNNPNDGPLGSIFLFYND